MPWQVLLDEAFELQLNALDTDLQDEILAHASVAFAFDPERKAILLAAGDKRGADQRRFYRQLIDVADGRFEEHLAALSATAGAAQTRKGRHGKEP